MILFTYKSMCYTLDIQSFCDKAC